MCKRAKNACISLLTGDSEDLEVGQERRKRGLQSTIVCGLLVALVSLRAVEAQDLPVPCGGSACGANGPSVWVSEGDVTGSVTGNTFNVFQSSDTAALNWASFNVGVDGVVNFNQPSESSVALNRIFQSDPAQIFGTLTSNGQIYLLSQNGIIFGRTAQVNVGGLVASTLDLTPAAVSDGIVGASRSGAPAFALFTDADGNPVESGSIHVEDGAFLGAEGGQIFLFAPNITNLGAIDTPDGQTILAAGEQIYLAASNDPNLRGLVVAVDGDGVVSNGSTDNVGRDTGALSGRISAARGNVTIASFAVNQLGLVSATTSVRQNGTIRLQAERGVTVQTELLGVSFNTNEAGDVLLGENSVTEIRLEEGDPSTTVDVNEQPRSTVDVSGRNVSILDAAQILATGGDVNVVARVSPQVDPEDFSSQPNDSRIYVGADAVIDVSGATANLSVTDNIVEVELRGNQLRDSPLQRDGPLRGQTVLVDIRRSGVRDDGSVWQGTPLADASGEISNVERTVIERNLAGGTISLSSEGDVIVDSGALLDISGGRINYAGGDVATTQVLGADGRLYDIADADRDREYTQLVDSYTVEYPRWGITEVFVGFPSDNSGRFEAAYVEGKDAGEITILAPRTVFDGAIQANVIRGRYQRFPVQPVAAASLYRPFDQVPAGGRLILGSAAGVGGLPNYVLGDVRFALAPTLPTLVGETGDGFDPLVDPLPEDYVTELRAGLLGPGRITNAQVFSNGRIEYDEGVAVSMPVGGRLALTASRIDFDGDYTAPGGALTLLAERTLDSPVDVFLSVGRSADVNLAGLWTNDNPSISDGGAPIFVNGGTFVAQAQRGDLSLSDGGRVDVSGGAHLSADGRLRDGSGGSIILRASPRALGDPSFIDIDAELFGHALDQGASLSISANSICIADNDCADDANEIWLSPDLYTPNGFSDITLTANLIGLEVVADTQVIAQQRNYLLTGDIQTIPTGTALATFAEIALRPEIERQPVSVTLTATAPSLPNFDYDAYNTAAGIVFGVGSRIDMDAGSRLSAESNSLLLGEGSIVTPGGEVELRISNSLIGVAGQPATGLWLTDSASIDVSGTALTILDDQGRLRGDVLDGGTIRLIAERDGIALGTGTVLDVSGTTADIDIPEGNPSQPNFVRRTIGSNGGELSLSASEYILANGEFRAAGGAVPGTAGGRFAVTIDGNLRGTDPTGGNREPSLSLDPRQIVVTAERNPILLSVGDAIPEALVGNARVSEASIEAGGFHDVSLIAPSLFSLRFGSQFLASQGDVSFEGGVDLHVPGQIVIDAANVSGGSGNVSLLGNYVRVGHGEARTQAIDDALPLRQGDFLVSANLIDFLGNVRLRGFDTAEFRSSGDIRAIGVQEQRTRELLGQLRTDANLILEASQVYPTTLSDFQFTVDGPGTSIDIRDSGNAPQLALSAAGQLRIAAETIRHAGRLRAPFGSLELDANSIELLDGSVTSTSLDGALVPFGTIQAGSDWAFQLQRNETLVFDGELNDIPQQTVRIDADTVVAEPGSSIDVSAGGDLLAYEFIPGVGGSTDFLAVEQNPNLFAILPGTEIDFAPFDPNASLGTTLNPGDSVYLDGIARPPCWHIHVAASAIRLVAWCCVGAASCGL